MHKIILLGFFLIHTLLSYSQNQADNLSHGPLNGTLIAIGGGQVGDDIMNEFFKYAGGENAEIVIIPTAMDDDYLQGDSTLIKLKSSFKRFGFKKITILHTRDSAQANNEDFILSLKTATGLYFTGGRQWRIADGFLNTKAHQEMFTLLERGGVIAGSSAGATIQGSYLARGDTENNQIMMGDHEEGLGFLTNVSIDQHVLARNRQFDMFSILKKRPELLGIGLDENTAIVVKGDTLEVIGRSYVAIYDQSFWSREGNSLKELPGEENLFYFLRSGDRYNLKDREIIEDTK